MMHRINAKKRAGNHEETCQALTRATLSPWGFRFRAPATRAGLVRILVRKCPWCILRGLSPVVERIKRGE